MVICDPYTVHTLVNSIFKQLQSLAARKGQLPRRNDDSLLLMRLLTLGISAWDIIDKQNFKAVNSHINLFPTVAKECLRYCNRN